MRYLHSTKLAVGVLALLFADGVWADHIVLDGAGATFPFPLYLKWFREYERRYPQVKINYQPIGSGAGIRQISERTVDFGATDVPLSTLERERATGLLHIPMAVGAVAVVYNGLPDGLCLSGELLADLFLGRVTRWNDPRVRALNPNLILPDRPVVVFHRSDGSGTTAVVTGYLSSQSAAFREQVGAGRSVRWPVGIGARGNDGIANLVETTPFGLGYIERAYAHQNGLLSVRLPDSKGTFVSPTVAGVANEDRTGQDPGYPLTAVTYLLVYRDALDRQKGEALVKLLWWALHDGQRLALHDDYAPLPLELVGEAEALVRSMTVEGKRVIAAH